MQSKCLLLVPMLISIAGCSETIEAQESEPVPSETVTPTAGTTEATAALQDQEVDLKLQAPVAID